MTTTTHIASLMTGYLDNLHQLLEDLESGLKPDAEQVAAVREDIEVLQAELLALVKLEKR